MMYKYMNKNPLNNQVDDCSVRAISVAEGISWDEAYDKLSNSARNLGLMMNSVEAIEEYLDERYDKIPHYSKYVCEFINEYPKRNLSSNNARSYNCNKKWNFI